MGINSKFYRSAYSIIQERRQKAEGAAQNKKNRIYSEIPELFDIERQLSQSMVGVARLALSGESSAQNGVKALAAANIELQNRKNELLAKNGVKPEDLSVDYYCKKCSDTGYDNNGEVCDCVKQLVRRLAYEELNSSTPLNNCTFESFDCERYSSDARDTMTKIYKFCRKYAANFSADSQSLMFTGGTGLGKTHLSLAIAGEAIENGFGVVYGQLSTILSKIEKEHFSGGGNVTLESVCECDLLILDDLGAEFSTQFTVSALYDIINTRLLNARPVIINTNLDVKQLEKQYGQRIVSRICGCYRCFEFCGEDLRIK